jgi:hypothetical protein
MKEGKGDKSEGYSHSHPIRTRKLLIGAKIQACSPSPELDKHA